MSSAESPPTPIQRGALIKRALRTGMDPAARGVRKLLWRNRPYDPPEASQNLQAQAVAKDHIVRYCDAQGEVLKVELTSHDVDRLAFSLPWMDGWEVTFPRLDGIKETVDLQYYLINREAVELMKGGAA